jgi:hypothetical protein
MQLNTCDTPPVVCLQDFGFRLVSHYPDQPERCRSNADVPTSCGSPVWAAVWLAVLDRGGLLASKCDFCEMCPGVLG